MHDVVTKQTTLVAPTVRMCPNIFSTCGRAVGSGICTGLLPSRGKAVFYDFIDVEDYLKGWHFELQ